MRIGRIIFISLLALLPIAWVVYSYSQIDLNLTISSNHLYQYFQRQMIQLGYFNRALSTAIFLFLISLSFILYFVVLYLVKKNKLTPGNILWFIIGCSIILFFSYPAFSHDIYNYIFDARIVTKYYQSPYLHTALDYPSDLWTRFMHWTHRFYPYGPVWLILTLPFSFLGLGKFVLTLVNFKLMFLLFHLGNIYLIYRILGKMKSKNQLFGTVFYALNPLVIIESLISPHNEVMMLFFLLLAIFLSITKNNIWSAIVSVLFSAGIKFLTIIYLPVFICYRGISAKLKTESVILFIYLLYLGALIYLIFQREPYPWYFIPVVGLSSLICNNRKIVYLTSALSIGSILRYAPFLYYGDYSKNVSSIMNMVFIIPVISVALYIIVVSMLRILRHKKK